MHRHVGFRLSLMMALVYAVQGAFWPILAMHLGDLGVGERARGWVFATFAVGSLVMPLGAGQLVDRFLPGQRVLSAIYAVAAGLFVVLATGLVRGPVALVGFFQVFWLLVAPAFSLAATIAMRHLSDPARQYPRVRLWGTIGWMAVGWVVSLVIGGSSPGRGMVGVFLVSGGLSLVLSAYALTLPNTPPLSESQRPTLAGIVDALKLARGPSMGRLLVTALGVHLTSPLVYQVLPLYLVSRGLPRPWVSTVMTLGQWPEIVALATLPWLLDRIGAKATMAVGLAAWATRFGSLAFDPPLWVAIAGIPLQGVGYACFTVAAQVFTDRQAPADRRASAQALYTVVTSGVGTLLGSVVAGDVLARFSGDYGLAFVIPCVIDVTLLGYFLACFRPRLSARAQELRTATLQLTGRHES